MEKNYKILGLEEGATLHEIVKKYDKLLKEFDPEKQGEGLQEVFKLEQEKVKEAYKEICLHLTREKEKKAREDEGNVEDRIKEGEIDRKESSFVQKILSDNLNNAAYWARIIGVIMIILGVIQIIELAKAYELFEDTYKHYDYEKSRNNLRPSFAPSFIYYGLCTLFFFMVGHAANKFATKIRFSLATQNHNILIEGLQMLSLYFKRILIFLIIIGVYSSFLVITTSYKDKTRTKRIAAEQILLSTPFTNLIIDYLEEKEKKQRKEEEERLQKEYEEEEERRSY